VELIPKALIIIMEFMIKNLLIEGQVENYILIMNLEQATFGLRSVRFWLCRLLWKFYRLLAMLIVEGCSLVIYCRCRAWLDGDGIVSFPNLYRKIPWRRSRSRERSRIVICGSISVKTRYSVSMEAIWRIWRNNFGLLVSID
jgi:hypothetical protein